MEEVIELLKKHDIDIDQRLYKVSSIVIIKNKWLDIQQHSLYILGNRKG